MLRNNLRKLFASEWFLDYVYSQLMSFFISLLFENDFLTTEKENIMNTTKKLTGVALASAAATLLLAGCGGDKANKAASAEKPAAEAKVAKIKCSGINSCKGTSACATATSACSGQNSCKGVGWVYSASKEECTTKGGKVI